MLIKKIYNFLLDLIFPKFCLRCNWEGFWLCQNCQKMIKGYHSNHCVICNTTSIQKICNNCQRKIKIDKLIIVTSYEDKTIAKLIQIYKYNFAKEIAEIISNLTINKLKKENLNNYAIIPVPLHRKRLKWREFNQAALIAENISQKFTLPLRKNILIRIKNTKPQAQIKDAHERKNNVKNAFKINSEIKKIPPKVLLIDDVGTTFGTLSECAKALKKAGVREIWGLVFAKG